MNKQIALSHNGMQQDIASSKSNKTYYFEGNNIRITSTINNTTGVVTNEKGNEFLLQIPTPTIDFINKIISYNDDILNYNTDEINNSYENTVEFGDQEIIGNCNTKDGFVIFSTNNIGFDCIWFLDYDTLTLKLLYLRNLGFSNKSPIQCINNYENSKIDKLYWVDGVHQIRFLNIHTSIDNKDLKNLIDVDISSLSFLSDVILTDPIIDSIIYGGEHTSGMIQYAYSLYSINGSQSALSPLSTLIPLGKSDNQGGDPNEIVGTIPSILINELDKEFTNLKLYAIKYTSYNQLPSVSLIADRSILGLNSFTYNDDGRILFDVSLEEFVLLTGKFVIPKHIEAKDNRLFLFNYKDKLYDLSIEKNNIDFRAYSFPINSSDTTVYESISAYDENTSTPTGVSTPINYTNNILNGVLLPSKHSAINGYYHLNKYQPNSNIIGGEGPFIKYEIIRTNNNKNDIYDFKFLKEDELYRIGIQLYNKYGIKSLPKWIGDFVTSSHDPDHVNLNGYYAGLKLTLKPEFYVWLNTSSNFLDDSGSYDEFLKPVGFKLLRAERTLSDRSIINQGIINGMMVTSTEVGYPGILGDIGRCHSTPKTPSLMRRFDDYLAPMFKNLTYDRLDRLNKGTHPQWGWVENVGIDSSTEVYKDEKGSSWRTSNYQFNKLMQCYSPEIQFNLINNIESSKLKVIGSLDNNFNGLKVRSENWATAQFNPYFTVDGVISYYDVKNPVASLFGRYEPFSRGIFGPTHTRDDYGGTWVTSCQLTRNYNGVFRKNTNPNNVYDIYGKPEISDFKQSVRNYNNDSELAYLNTLEPVRSDQSGDDNDPKTSYVALDTVLSAGSRCATFALGADNIDTINRPSIEELFNNSSMKDDMPGELGGIGNVIVLDKVISFNSDLISTTFTNEYVGVLETGNIYYNNNISNIINSFDTKNVIYTFNDLASYDLFMSTEIVDHTGIRIAIVDHIDNKIYEIIDQNTSLAGLIDTSETFDYLEDVSIVNKYVTTLPTLYNLDISLLNDGYTVGVIANTTIYTLDKENSLWEETGIFSTTPGNEYKGGAGLIVEFINDNGLKYIGNYYGGNSYEAKSKTVYVEASNYFSINGDFSFISVDPGDVFVQDYPIARISKIESTPIWYNQMRITEVIKVRLESTVNQNKRNDESKDVWSSSFSPSQGNFHSYNRVYSQTPNLIKSQDFSYELKNNELYDTGILASRLKRPGETIDNWSNLSINDTMFLEGKYGAINGVVKYNDTIFTFQDTAVCKISINPRVQIQGSDGVGIELGTGTLLHDYTYITTNSGSSNKWGIISTKSGIYYYDVINNILHVLSDQIIPLSDQKQLNTFFKTKINPLLISEDNHLLKKGIQIGYDYTNSDIYFTFQQLENSKTISFNESRREFTSLHDFKPSLYFIRGDDFLTTNPNNKELYKHKEGIYNQYYNEYYPSSIIYNVNPEPYNTCVFDNIDFKSEVYHNGEDLVDSTITDIQAYNDYQDSTLVPLVNGRNGNLRRRFRDWNAEIPRDGRNRIRGPWTKLKLNFENEDDKKIVLHDIIVSYTT